MKFQSYIAFRYLFTKKSTNVINIISGISIAGISVGAMALVIVLSGFNGLERLVEKLYSSFDPDIKITLIEGKHFDTQSFPFKDIQNLNAVNWTAQAFEETAVLKYKDQQTFAVVKGVEDSYLQNSHIDSVMYDGSAVINANNEMYAIAGYGIADKLSIFIDHVFEPIFMYAAKGGKNISINPANAFKSLQILPAGIFAINPDFDNKYVLVPLEFSQKLFDKKNRATSVEIGLNKEFDEEKIAEQIKAIVGTDFNVETRYQMNEILYKTNNSEKWITFLILSFILIIAAFNMIGTLIMIIIDKSKDIKILKSMGASAQNIKQIFLIEGLGIAMIGGVSGILLGLLFVFLQQTVGIVPLSGVIVDYYPMDVEAFDLISVFIIVFVIGFIGAYVPASIVSRNVGR